MKHKAEIEVNEFVRRLKLLFKKYTRFIYGLLFTKRNEDVVPCFPTLFNCRVTGRKLMEDYVYIGLDFFPRKYCEKKVILRKRMIVVGQECRKNSENEVGTERLMS